MKSISLCIIAKNEKDKIYNCLQSIRDVFNEIIFVDTGSTDNTIEIAKEFTNKIYNFEWIDDFSAARNFAFSKATSDYIMWLDADDILKEEDRNKLIKLKEDMDGDIDYYSMMYDYRHDDNGVCTYSFRRNRIVRNNGTFYWDGPIHEALVTNGICKDTDITITHTNNHDNGQKYINFFRKRINNGKGLTPREKYYYGGELTVFGDYDEALEVLLDFLNDKYPGRYENRRACDYIGDIYRKRKDYKRALRYYYKYFEFDIPTIQLLDKISSCYNKLNDKQYECFWSSIISLIDIPDRSLTKFANDNEIKIKHSLNGCLTNFNIGNLDQAERCNDRIGKINPDNNGYKYNVNFFNSLKEK